MISWIQRTFQQHFRTMFLALLVVIIISFVFTIGSPGLGSNSRQNHTAMVFGETIASEQDKSRLGEMAQISSLFSGSQNLGGAYGRLALKHLADTMGVPQPTTDQFKEFIRTRPAFRGPNAQYDPQKYAQFLDLAKTQAFGFSEAQAQQVLIDDWRIEHIQSLLTGPGYIADADVKREFDNQETLWSVETATLDLQTVQSTAEPTPEELNRWFEATSARYNTPEQIRVDYVEFTAADFAAKVKVNDDDIVAYFDRNKARYQKPPAPAADGTTPPPPAETTLAEVRDQVIGDLTQARAANLASGAASDFAVALFNAEVIPDSEKFDQFIASTGLALKSAPPFSRDQPPAGLAWPPAVANGAFRLTDKNPISNELRTANSTVILFFRELIAAAPSPLENVRDRVMADVRNDKRRQAIVARGEELRRQLTTAVKSGQSFADAAKAATLEVKSWEKFKPSAPPADFDYSILQNLAANKEREVSQMSVQGEKGTLVFVAAKQLPDPAAATESYDKTRQAVMEQAATMAGNIALVEVIKKEVIAAGLERPETTR